MKYVINDINKKEGWASLTVTFDDGKTYDKKMMVDMESEDSIHESILRWLSDYIPARDKEAQAYDPKTLEGKTTTFTQADLDSVKEK